MPKFRKKPVVIEAYQWTFRSWEHQADWPKWLYDAHYKSSNEVSSLFTHGDGNGNSEVRIHTLEGDHTVSDYDWIIQGVAGELYPCKPDIFDRTYDPA